MEAPRLPDRATCLHLLRSNPLIIATPLGASYTVLCHVTSVLDSQGPAIIVTGHVPAPQPSPHVAPAAPDEITAALTSFIVPFTPSPSLRSSAAPTPEPGEFPLLLSPSPGASRGHPEAHLSDPILPRAPAQAAHPMSTPVAAAARGYSSAVSPSGSPAQSASPNLSAIGSHNGVDALRAHAGAPPFQPRGLFAGHPGSPPHQPGAEAGAVSAVRDLGFGMRALAVDTHAGHDGVPQRIMPSWQEIEVGGAHDGAVGGGASPEGSPAWSIVERAADEEAWAEAQAEVSVHAAVHVSSVAACASFVCCCLTLLAGEVGSRGCCSSDMTGHRRAWRSCNLGDAAFVLARLSNADVQMHGEVHACIWP